MAPNLQSSLAPDGTVYPVPTPEAVVAGLAEIRARAADKRVVVVQGLGFVGSAVAAVVAAARNPDGSPTYFVVGVDLATAGAYWKIAKLNEGKVPIASPDAEFDRLVHEAVNVTGNLCATGSQEAYGLAEVIVVDVHLDVIDRAVRAPDDIQINLAGFEAAIRAVGRGMRPDALVLVETTVPFGVCEKVILPALQQERSIRSIHSPLYLAHAYERVMPGPRYIDSIRRFWRTFSGIDPASAQRARTFLDSFINTTEFPLRQLENTASSEMAKILENSFRAANIAFIHEWTLLAERAGINLWEVVDSIRVRKGTHDNMRYPGFGVGGYCLTKDSLLAQWSALNLFGSDHVLSVTMEALRINHEMPLHSLGLLKELAGGELAGKRVLVCGISYLPDVADTRNSPTEIFVDELAKTGAEILVNDPCLLAWLERPDVQLAPDLLASLAHVDAVIFAVPHAAYRRLEAGNFPKPLLIVDANNVLDDARARKLHAQGCRLAGVGKGHWRSLAAH